MSGKERSWKLCILLCALALLFMSGKPLYGQSQVTATLSGTVTDPAGAIVNGAKATLTSPEHGISWTSTTQGAGLYSFTLLPPETYTLVVEAAGFKRYTQEGITLAAGQAAEQNVKLTIGAVTENIEVTAQAPLLNVENANISSDVSAKQTADLPLNFRSVISLAMLSSSVSNNAEQQAVGAPGLAQTADQDISFLNFGGTFFNSAEYLLDGTWDTRSDWGGVIYTPSVDDVQELKIQTNAFTAQYGFSSGNVVNMVTKSGSNEFHGDVYEFYANTSMDARYYFNNGAQPAVHRNQFGGTIGGPIKKNKLYFFAYYEGLRQAQGETSVFTMPPSAFRTGDFSGLLGGGIGTDYVGRPIYSGELYNPFTTRLVTDGALDTVTGATVVIPGGTPGVTTAYLRDPLSGNAKTGMGVTNVLPTGLLDTIASSLASGSYWPAPQSSAMTNNFTGTAAAPETSNEYSGRVDYNISDNDRINARWSRKYQQKTNTPTFYGASDIAGPGLVNPNNRFSVNIGESHVFSPTFAMNANVGVNRHVEGGRTQNFGFQDSTLGLPSWLDGISPVFPEFTEQGYANLGPSGGNDNYITPQALWTESVDLTKVKGTHQLAFGFMDVWLRLDGGHWADTVLPFDISGTYGPDPSNPTGTTGNGFASFLLGVSNGTGHTGYNAFPATDKHFLGWYFQDAWKLTRKFTLSMGLRYEIQTAPTERFNAQDYFDFTARNPISGLVGTGAFFPGEVVYNSNSNRGWYHTNHTNLAPRIGFAYQVANKLALRGGYGIFYVPSVEGQGNNDGFSQTTPWTQTINGFGPSSTLSGNANATCFTTAVVACPSAFASGELTPSANSLGGLTDVGFGPNAMNQHRLSSFVQQWMGGLQYSFTNNDLLDISYVGNQGANLMRPGLQRNVIPTADLSLGNKLNTQVPNPFFVNGASVIPQSGCGLNNPTITLTQSLMPYPEYCSVYEQYPAIGMSNYNALQATYTHRWHSGLNLNVSYTFSKFLDDTQGSSGWAFPGNGAWNVLNPNNINLEKSVDVSDTPHSLRVNYNYELPFGKGKQFGSQWNGVENAILGGWAWSGILSATSGLPLSVNPVGYNAGPGMGQRPNFVSGVSLVPANQSITNWVNRAAFSQPAAYTFGDVPRFISNLRGPRFFDWDMSILKRWNFTEHKQLEFRFEMFNAFNHPNFYEPDPNLGDLTFGVITAAYQQRLAQIAAKFYF